MKKLFATGLFSGIAMVSFAQTKSFNIINNKVYEVSYNENGSKVFTEVGALEKTPITEGCEINKIYTPNAWKFSANITADYSYEIPKDESYNAYSIGGMLSLGGKYKDKVYLGVGTGVINTTLKIDEGNCKMDCNYCSIPVFGELNLNTKSNALTTQLYANLKVGSDIIVNDQYTYDGRGIFTTRLSAGLMIADHVMVGVTYKLQAKDDCTTHGIGVNLSYRF